MLLILNHLRFASETEPPESFLGQLFKDSVEFQKYLPTLKYADVTWLPCIREYNRHRSHTADSFGKRLTLKGLGGSTLSFAGSSFISISSWTNFRTAMQSMASSQDPRMQMMLRQMLQRAGESMPAAVPPLVFFANVPECVMLRQNVFWAEDQRDARGWRAGCQAASFD